jgi:hypothetical protein
VYKKYGNKHQEPGTETKHSSKTGNSLQQELREGGK